jgi:hypothetical protein
LPADKFRETSIIVTSKARRRTHFTLFQTIWKAIRYEKDGQRGVCTAAVQRIKKIQVCV